MHFDSLSWMIILFKYFNNFIISNIDKEVNKGLPEDDLIEDRNMLECFLECLNDFNIT